MTLLPIAHAGHWTALLYALPVLIVLGSVVRTMVLDRRASGSDEKEDESG